MQDCVNHALHCENVYLMSNNRYYGLMSQRFCYINRNYQEIFEDCFVKQYQLIHRLETNKLRNVAKLFAHLLSTDAISWAVLQAVRITEDDTTSSSRIFIKVLFQVRVDTTRIVPSSKLRLDGLKTIRPSVHRS